MYYNVLYCAISRYRNEHNNIIIMIIITMTMVMVLMTTTTTTTKTTTVMMMLMISFNSLARRQLPDVGRDSSQHSGRLIPACHVPLCRWRCWNCFGKEGIQILCPSFRLSFATDRLRESQPAEWVGSWLPGRGRSSLQCFIPRSTRDLFPVPAAVSLDTALQLGAHSWVILSWRRSGPVATVDILFLASCF